MPQLSELSALMVKARRRGQGGRPFPEIGHLGPGKNQFPGMDHLDAILGRPDRFPYKPKRPKRPNHKGRR